MSFSGLLSSNKKEKTILSDNKSNFYYNYYATAIPFKTLRQVNYTDPTNISATQYIIDSESVENFIVDDIIYVC